MLSRDFRQRLDAFGDPTAVGSVNLAALDAKIAELSGALVATRNQYFNQYGVTSITQLQDVLYGSHVGDALDQCSMSMSLLEGVLYDAVTGDHVFPLDNGTAPNPVAALESWNRIAQDMQDSLSGVLGYLSNWGPLPSIEYAAGHLANPLNWPWWLQLGAGLAIYTYVRPLLGLLPSRRKT